MNKKTLFYKAEIARLKESLARVEKEKAQDKARFEKEKAQDKARFEEELDVVKKEKTQVEGELARVTKKYETLDVMTKSVFGRADGTSNGTATDSVADAKGGNDEQWGELDAAVQSCDHFFHIVNSVKAILPRDYPTTMTNAPLDAARMGETIEQVKRKIHGEPTHDLVVPPLAAKTLDRASKEWL